MGVHEPGCAVLGNQLTTSTIVLLMRLRPQIKTAFRLGLGTKWRPPQLSGKSDAALRAAAGRTNAGVNAYGGGVAASAAIGSVKCGGGSE